MNTLIKKRINQANEVVSSLHDSTEDIALIAKAIIECFANGGTLFAAGNGGSATHAIHLCEELTGRFRDDRPALPALSLCSDASTLTCIANDFGWNEVFKRQLEAHAMCMVEEDDSLICNDVLLVLTTSGNSENINFALDEANRLGMATIGLLGRDGGNSLEKCDLSLTIDAIDSAAIQDGHHVVIHAICEVIESWIIGLEELNN